MVGVTSVEFESHHERCVNAFRRSTMFDADQIIFEAAARRIKDCQSNAERRRILQALLVKITINHPAWKICSISRAAQNRIWKKQTPPGSPSPRPKNDP